MEHELVYGVNLPFQQSKLPHGFSCTLENVVWEKLNFENVVNVQLSKVTFNINGVGDSLGFSWLMNLFYTAMARWISKAVFLSLATTADITGYHLVEPSSGALKGCTRV